MKTVLSPFQNPWPATKTPATPFYVYSEKRLRELHQNFLANQADGFLQHHFAMKANNNRHVLQFFQKNKFGLDVVSGHELRLGLKAKFPASKIVFSGVGKTDEEIELAIQKGIASLNIESADELARATRLAKRLKKKLRVAFRVNPDVEAKTHPYISTGLREHKFGVDFREAKELYARAKKSPNLVVEGIAFHIGSQLFDLSALKEAADKTISFAQELKTELGISLAQLDVGGGLGVDYETPERLPPFEAYGKFLNEVSGSWRKIGGAIVKTECGRALISQAGFLISRVIQTKLNGKKNFLILDASMTELIRPALYEAYHAIEPWSDRASPGEKTEFDVVGPVCESGDFLGVKRLYHAPKAGQLFVISCAGAYGAVMASHYNGRPLPAEYWVNHRGRATLSRPARPIQS